MAIKLIVSDTVKFQVKGVIRNASGTDEPFNFSLICKRLNAEEIQARFRADEETLIVEFFAGIVEDWSGVRDAEDKPAPYNVENLRALFKLPGIAALAFRTYMAECGAREKN